MDGYQVSKLINEESLKLAGSLYRVIRYLFTIYDKADLGG